jgi:hypothetical protein
MAAKRATSFWRNQGLTIVLGLLFVGCLAGQTLTGWSEENNELHQHGRPPVTLSNYVRSGSFVEVTAENWESEFLQMFAYVLLTVSLYQRGSAESKDPDKKEEVDRAPDPKRPGAPAAVRRGGAVLWLYERSLGIAFLLLFAVSFLLHAVGGAASFNEEARLHHERTVTVLEYFATSRFWYESFQNWQSEFLAIGAMVVLSIWLRQRGSPESKPVDAPHKQTGE